MDRRNNVSRMFADLTGNEENLKLYKLLGKPKKTQEDYEIFLELMRDFECNFFLHAAQILSQEDFRSLVDQTKPIFKFSGAKLFEANTHSNFIYTLLDGEVSYCEEYEIDEAGISLRPIHRMDRGSYVSSSIRLHSKCSPYTMQVQSEATILQTPQNLFVRIFKRAIQREQQDLLSDLAKTGLFQGVANQALRRFLPHLIPKRLSYKDAVYDFSDQWSGAYFVISGEITLERICPNSRSALKIVKLMPGEMFGMEQANLATAHSHQDRAFSNDSDAEVLFIPAATINQLISEIPLIQQNLIAILEKAIIHRNALFTKTQNILVNNIIPEDKPVKKRAPRRKKRGTPKIQWWGLASNFEYSKRYKLPEPPKKTAEAETKPATVESHFGHKIQEFKRRLLDRDLVEFEQQEQAEIENSPWQAGFRPKLAHVKRKMLSVVTPKAMNVTETIKKDLLTYAKNTRTFCDRFNFN